MNLNIFFEKKKEEKTPIKKAAYSQNRSVGFDFGRGLRKEPRTPMKEFTS
jgi:hypothetical protein